MKYAGIDVSPGHSFLCVLSDDGWMDSYPEIDDFSLLELATNCDVVVIETPEVGFGWRQEVARSLMPTIHHCGELAGSLKQLLGGKQWLLQPAPEMIREHTCGWVKQSRVKADPFIKNWLKRDHLELELGLDQEAIKKLLGSNGRLSTPDKRDAYLAALFGKLVMASKYMQIKCFGKDFKRE